MPKIPQYQSTQNVAGQTQFRTPSPENLGAGTGRALQQVGDSVSNLGAQIQGFQERRDLSKANKNVSALRATYAQELTTAEQNANFGDDVTSDILTKYDKDVSSLMEFDTAKGRSEFERMSLDFRNVLAQKSITAQVKRQGAGAALDFQKEMDANGQLIQSDPSMFGNIANEMVSQLDDDNGRFAKLSRAKRTELKTEVIQNLASNAAMGTITQSPREAVFMATEGTGPFAHLSAEKRGTYTNAALSNYRTQMQFVQGQEDRERNGLERQQRDTEENTSKLMDTQFASGKLTATEVQANKDKLTPAAYRFNLERVSTGRKATTVPDVYSDLYTRALNGEDVLNEATEEYHGYRLEVAHYNKILDVHKDGPKVPAKFTEAEQYVKDAMRPDPANPSFGQPFRHAESVADIREWMKDNKNASAAEAMAAARGIVTDRSLVNQTSFSINTPTPRFMSGNRQMMDFQATVEATDQAYETGELSEKEYDKQLNLIEQWQLHLAQPVSPTKVEN